MHELSYQKWMDVFFSFFDKVLLGKKKEPN